jgi:ribosome biogenesis GTPase / thiamine phosphate phosphatase
MEARIEPVLVLTKSDLAADVDERLRELSEAAPTIVPVALDARSPAAAAQLSPWLAVGQTVACVGSSGVGKSTLINTLCGDESQTTGAIRADDGKGRHTTTARQLLPMPAGAWLIDTPGMRELKLGAVTSGVQAVFADIEQLAEQCRFRDCKHQGDAGCAVTAAVTAGALDARRLNNYFKLQREAERATQSLHERHAQMRQFGRMAKSVMQAKRRRRDGGD